MLIYLSLNKKKFFYSYKNFHFKWTKQLLNIISISFFKKKNHDELGSHKNLSKERVTN